jgi:hypothetical protein
MVEDATLFQHADVEIALVAESDGVSAGHGHPFRARALRIEACVRVKPGPAKRQCSRLEVVRIR